MSASKTSKTPKADAKSKAKKASSAPVYQAKTLDEMNRIYYAVIEGDIIRNRRTLVGTVEGLATDDAAQVRAVITDKAEREVFDAYLAKVKDVEGNQVPEGMALLNLSKDLRANGQIRPKNQVTGKRQEKTSAVGSLTEILAELLKTTPGVKEAATVAAKRGQVVEVDYNGQILQVHVKTA